MSLNIDYKAVGGTMTVRGDGAAEWDFGWSAKDVPADPQTARLAAVAPDLLAADDDKTVLFWKNEERVLGKLLDCWNQSSVGSCVSHGWGRGVQDLMLHEIAAGEPEEWPGAEVCREAIYGGSRVEVGGGRIRGDGSVGEWAAKWVKNWGIILYAKYGSVDLTDGYRVDRCRKWGDSGCPDALEPEAKKHPVTDVALVMTAAEAWAAVGGGKPVAVCSDVGYDSPLVEGFCRRSGSWAHCMVVRGRFLHPTRGKSFVIGNSWGDYLAGRGDPTVRTADAGDVRLPPGSFAVTAADLESMLRQQDSYAMAGLTGWRKTRVDHTP